MAAAWKYVTESRALTWMSQQLHQYSTEIRVIGPSTAGKTSLLNCLTEFGWAELVPTLTDKVRSVRLVAGDRKSTIVFNATDTSGSCFPTGEAPTPSNITKLLWGDYVALVYVFSIASVEQTQTAIGHLEYIANALKERPTRTVEQSPLFIIVNKMDLFMEGKEYYTFSLPDRAALTARQEDLNKLRALSARLQEVHEEVRFFCTCAKKERQYGVKEAFDRIGRVLGKFGLISRRCSIM
jgi:GTPase SAR1 family protein